MSKKHWRELPIGKCLSESFAGEWGAEPNPANARVLRATDINNEGQINLSGGAPRRIPAKKKADKRLQAGDILLEGSGGSPEQPVGRVAFFPGVEGKCDFLCSNFFRTLRPDPFIANPRFLFWKLMWFYKQPRLLTLQQQTTGLINLKFDEYKESTVSVPEDISEQGKIAEVIDTLDTAIHQTEAIVEKLKQVKQGLLHDLLTRGIDANGELRPSHEQAPHLYQETRLGWIPKDWTLRSVASLGEIKSGSTPSRGKANRYFHPEGTPWVKTLDLNEDVIFKTDECITGAALRESSCSILPVGSVLIAMYGGWEQIGRTAMLGVPSATNQAISTVTINDPEVVPEYVLRALQHGRPRWKRVAASTRKDPNITKMDVETFELPMPSNRAEQGAIVTRFRALLNRLAIEQLELHKRQEEKAGAMDDLLTGRVRVTPLLAQ